MLVHLIPGTILKVDVKTHQVPVPGTKTKARVHEYSHVNLENPQRQRHEGSRTARNAQGMGRAVQPKEWGRVAKVAWHEMLVVLYRPRTVQYSTCM